MTGLSGSDLPELARTVGEMTKTVVPQLSNPLLEAAGEGQPLIGDDRRYADSSEKPRAATRRDADQHGAEREEGAERDVSFQRAQNAYA